MAREVASYAVSVGFDPRSSTARASLAFTTFPDHGNFWRYVVAWALFGPALSVQPMLDSGFRRDPTHA